MRIFEFNFYDEYQSKVMNYIFNRPNLFRFWTIILLNVGAAAVVLTIFLLTQSVVLSDGHNSTPLRINKVERWTCLTESSTFRKFIRHTELPSNLTKSSTTIKGHMWSSLNNYYKTIWKKVPKDVRLLSHRAKSTNRMTHFIEFLRPNDNCNTVWIGINNSIDAPLKLFVHYPQCHFLVVDEKREKNKDLVEKILGGKLVWTATGNGSEEIDPSLQQRTNGDEEKSQALQLLPLLNKYNEDSTIDLLVINANGSELDLLSQIMKDDAELPTICQISVNIHFSRDNNQNIASYLINTLNKMEKYVVLKMDMPEADRPDNAQIFMLNNYDEECSYKFLCNEKL